MSYEEPMHPELQRLWEQLTHEMPLRSQETDRQQWAIARFGLDNPNDRLVYFEEALTPSHWVEILHAYQAGDLTAIGYIFDQAIRTKEMMARVDAAGENEP